MNIRTTRLQLAAFTRLELFVVVSLIAVLLSMLVLTLTKPRARTSAIKCSSNLKMIVLSAKMFAGDNDGSYPFSATNSPAYQDTNVAWRHFLSMSNELGSTKILICRYDVQRVTNTAATFGDYKDPRLASLEGRQNSALSYFIALRTQENANNSQGVFFGDRNLLIPAKKPDGSRLKLASGDQLQWDASLHNRAGNIAYEDGSVASLSSSGVNSETQTVDLLLPIIP